jgi:hypothetical protein
MCVSYYHHYPLLPMSSVGLRPLAFASLAGERGKSPMVSTFRVPLRAKGSARSSRVLSHGTGTGLLGRGYRPNGRKPGHQAKYTGSPEHFRKMVFSNMQELFALSSLRRRLHVGRAVVGE